jgi:hypothetical protein
VGRAKIPKIEIWLIINGIGVSETTAFSSYATIGLLVAGQLIVLDDIVAPSLPLSESKSIGSCCLRVLTGTVFSAVFSGAEVPAPLSRDFWSS